ncbi:MAG: hypothetical protein ABFS37_00395 [Acidobacteriota bacterium]
MLMLCPECGRLVDFGGARCSGGHIFQADDGVVSLLSVQTLKGAAAMLDPSRPRFLYGVLRRDR